MKSTCIIVCYSLLLSACCLYSQTSQYPISEKESIKSLQKTNSSGWLLFPVLDSSSQSNVVNGKIVVTVSDFFGDGQPCPAKYTNLISNTNLFTLAEQKLLKDIFAKYKDVTTNSGPVGSILTNLVKTNGDWILARFQYTNSDAIDDMIFAPPNYDFIEVKSRRHDGSGYDLTMGNRNDSTKTITEFWQIRQNVSNGLYVQISNDHCIAYRTYTNGMVIGKWFVWNNEGKLTIEAEFKEPYDFERHVLPLDGM